MHEIVNRTIEEKYAELIKQREDQDGNELSILNLGPTHPATHGIFQNVLLMDGERILEAEPTIGYIHRAFEKIAENRPFYQITPLTDRMNYCSSPINNMGWWLTVEKLLGIEVPKRAQYIRVIMMELARIADHLICNSILAVDSGAFTGFLYVMQYREKIYEIFEELCGARLTTNMGRMGGLERDLSDAAFRKLDTFLKDFPPAFKEFEEVKKSYQEWLKTSGKEIFDPQHVPVPEIRVNIPLDASEMHTLQSEET